MIASSRTVAPSHIISQVNADSYYWRFERCILITLIFIQVLLLFPIVTVDTFHAIIEPEFHGRQNGEKMRTKL